MEFFLKEHTYNDIVLQKYKDYSRKIIAQTKLNQNAILAKACPTSKACVKFLINTQLELNIELIPGLINVLGNISAHGVGVGEQGFIVVAGYENWKKELIRLVYCTG